MGFLVSSVALTYRSKAWLADSCDNKEVLYEMISMTTALLLTNPSLTPVLLFSHPQPTTLLGFNLLPLLCSGFDCILLDIAFLATFPLPLSQ